MNTNTDLIQTPLQNLFYYIRDLYNARQDCIDFEQEAGNPKTPGQHYWELGKLLALARGCAQKHLPDFALGIGGSTDQASDFILKIRRIEVPAEPKLTLLEEKIEPTDPVNVENARRQKEYNAALKEYNQKYGTHLAVNACYDALHSMYYELRGRSNKRLYLSFGLVTGQIGEQPYRNFLFHIPLRIKLKNHEIRIESDTFAGKIFAEQYFAELLDAHFPKESPSVVEERKKEVLVAVDRFNAQSLECFFAPEFIRTEYYDKGWEMLGVFPQKKALFFKDEDLDYTFYADEPGTEITFSFSPILQTKIIADQMAISKDAGAIIRSINELQSGGALQRVPDFFRKLFSLPAEEIRVEDDQPERYLFPLPFNQEQFEIAKRLSEQDAVTVKGPPGTGKSHTIANLISHFVSQGKSILVVSHNAKALSVLKDKLPRGIQDLAVSLVGEGKGNESLKASVSAIIRHISQRYEESRIESLEGQLSALENKYALLLSEMYRIVQANTERLEIGHPVSGHIEDRSAYEWAVFLHSEAVYTPVLLKDAVDYTTDTTGLSEKLQSLTVISNQFQPDDFDLIHYHFLQDHVFPEVQQLRRIELRLEEITQAIQLDVYSGADPLVADEAFLASFGRVTEQLNGLERTSFARELFFHKDFDRSVLRQLLHDNASLREQVSDADNQLLPYDLDLAPITGADPDILYRQINQLIVKFGNHPTISWVTRNLLDKALKAFFACRINYNAVSTIDDFRLIEKSINRERCLKQLNITFQNYLKRFGIIAPPISETLRELDTLAAFIEALAEFNIEGRTRKLPALNPSAPDFDQVYGYISGLGDYAEYCRIREYLAQAKGKLINHDDAHPLIFNIARALEYVNRANYELYLGQYREKRQRQPAAIRFDQLYKEVGRVLPHTVLFIKDSRKLFPTRSDIEQDLFYARLHSFLEHVTGRTRGASSLLTDLQTVKRGIEKQTAELISYKAWFNKSQKVGDIQKAALNAWLNDLINIGKGFGKNTARNIASAIRNMQIAKEAVPIWIMQQETAVTFFPDATPGQFDLLIIDEASQCDISSLNLIYRCKKCLIVGDENQTSVMADRSWFTIDRTNELLDKYLISHRFKTQFDVNNRNNSIYTISGVIYPNVVTLTEHFRCLPEIIGYSNQYMYNKEIVPLKTATEYPFGEPIGIEYSEDDPSSAEKPQVVRKVAETIEGYIKDYQEGRIKRLPTIGIIALDSSNQEHQQALLREIAGSDLIKQYEDQLELLIGTSREFQGDERDVMLLTITASHTVRKEGDKYTLKPPRAATTEEYMRIYNVAASRAKERSVVFHSIHSDAVALMNPDCYRRKLIDYYTLHAAKQTSAPVTTRTLSSLLDQVDVYAGEFQSSVCRFLFEHGWGDYLFPQMQIGKYRIDFGLISGNRKLAIECDGFAHHSGMEKIREDIQRQLILERANWHFFRIQSTDWFYRREAVGEALLGWIKESLAQ